MKRRLAGLWRAVETFRWRQEWDDWADPEGARGQGEAASRAFLALLAEQKHCWPRACLQPLAGRPASVIEASRTWQPLGEDEPARHCVVFFPNVDICLDWTARQYEPAASFPVMTNRQSLEERGWTFLPPAPEEEELQNAEDQPPPRLRLVTYG